MARHIRSENQPMGLDEIMIVNPSPRQADSQTSAPDQELPLFLGEDNMLYGLFGPEDRLQEGDFLLGQDGRLYRVTLHPANGESIFLG